MSFHGEPEVGQTSEPLKVVSQENRDATATKSTESGQLIKLGREQVRRIKNLSSWVLGSFGHIRL